MQLRLIHTIKHMDVSLFCWCMASARRPALARISRVVSRSGDGYYYALIPLALYLTGMITDPNFYLCLLSAFTLERISYYSVKLSCKRDRPASAIDGFVSAIKPADQFSFPSGHTSAAFLFATQMGFWFPAIQIPLLAWATLVGLSRFFLGVHFITDIIVGASIGSLIGYLTLAIII